MNVAPRPRLASLSALAAAATLALAAGGFASEARAGVVLEFQDISPGEPPTTSKAWGGSDRVRVEIEGNVLIFRGDKQVAWLIQPDGTYIEMTKEGMAGVADAMKELEAQLAGLPPEQRAMVEAMMKQQGAGAGSAPAAPQAPLTWTRNGKSDTVGGRACLGWDGSRAGRVEEEACATEWAALGFSRDDFAGFERMAEFMKTMTGPISQQVQARIVDETLDGMPLRLTRRSPQGPQVHEVTKIEKADVPASLFELPPGLRKQSMGDMADPGEGRRGRR